jgi:hypothetical protein
MEGAYMKIDGSCHCGYITFEAEADPAQTGICHCIDCQQLTGSAFRTFIRVATDTFRILSGEPTTYFRTGDSGRTLRQGFCPRCGSPIYSTAAEEQPKFHSLRPGTIRQRDQLVPQMQIWCRSQVPWLTTIASMHGIEKE